MDLNEFPLDIERAIPPDLKLPPPFDPPPWDPAKAEVAGRVTSRLNTVAANIFIVHFIAVAPDSLEVPWVLAGAGRVAVIPV
jgi:hypothetical protein